jgi:hypothetical protein
VLVINETGFLEKAPSPPEWPGSTPTRPGGRGLPGRVFLAYAAPAGRMFIDRELCLPRPGLRTASATEAGIGADVRS